MKIAVFGAGMVGGALAKRLAAVGHEVCFGVPEPQSDKMKKLLGEIEGARAGSVAEAARLAELIVLATPWEATQKAISYAGDLTGKIVIDCAGEAGNKSKSSH